MASTRPPAFVAPDAIVPVAQRPSKESFTLPDLTQVQFEEEEKTGQLTISVAQRPTPKEDGSHKRFPAQTAQHDSSLQVLLRVSPLPDRLANVSFEQVNPDRATFLPVLRLERVANKVSFSDFWACLYALWVRKDALERVAVHIDSSFDQQRAAMRRFLLQTGLASQRQREAKEEFDVILDRAAFWQGAGAPLDRSWLQNPFQATSEFGQLANPTFPFVSSFTRSDDPPVLTTHPLRAPKPAPGTIVYSRYVHSVKQHFQLTVVDWRNEEHFSHYTKWQNSDRVNHGWRERGNDEHHRAFLQGRESDPHTMGLLSSWDGEYAGYSEASFSKEDGMSAFVGGMGDFDQGTHSLVGEERFRGRHRFAHNMISLKHFCFLREPRSDKVIGEPRFDLSIIPLLAAYLPQSKRKEIELPHKRAVFFILHRDRFFSEAMFY